VAVAFALRSIQGVQKFHNFTKLELVETPQTPILLKSSIHEVSKYMSCIESSICVECSGGLKIDSLSPFSARPKRVWVEKCRSP
jgi:hypothetical protein